MLLVSHFSILFDIFDPSILIQGVEIQVSPAQSGAKLSEKTILTSRVARNTKKYTKMNLEPFRNTKKIFHFFLNCCQNSI